MLFAVREEVGMLVERSGAGAAWRCREGAQASPDRLPDGVLQVGAEPASV